MRFSLTSKQLQLPKRIGIPQYSIGFQKLESNSIFAASTTLFASAKRWKFGIFFRRVAKIKTSLQALWWTMLDGSHTSIILRTFAPSFLMFVACFNVAGRKPSFEELVNLLQQEEAIHGETLDSPINLASHLSRREDKLNVRVVHSVHRNSKRIPLRQKMSCYLGRTQSLGMLVQFLCK